MKGRLEEIRNRADIPDLLKADLLVAEEFLSELERELLRAEDLREKHRTELLGDEQARELSTLLWSSRGKASAYRPWFQNRLGWWEKEGALASAGGRALQELQRRTEDARSYLYANDRHWEQAPRRVSTTLPSAAGTEVVVHSQIVPGAALGTRLAGGYSTEDSLNRYSGERFRHVPDLAQSTLIDASGRVLYSGLRHGIIHAGELDADLLRGLTDDELRDMVSALPIENHGADAASQAHAGRIEEWCRYIRSSGEYATLAAGTMERRACLNMAKETAAAALVSDPAKFRRALAGETVDLNLFCVSLLNRGEFDAWLSQCAAFNELGRSMPVQLRLCDQRGEPHIVAVNARVRQFVLSAEAEGATVTGRPQGEVVRLLGQSEAGQPESQLSARVDDMHARIRGSCRETDALLQEYVRNSRDRGGDHPPLTETRSRISTLQTDRERLERSAQTLETIGQQLNAMRAETRGWPTGIDSYKKAASRLALAGYLMDETPILSCMSGREFTAELDPEIKFLATVAENQHGHLPPADLDSEQWRAARGNFMPQ